MINLHFCGDVKIVGFREDRTQGHEEKLISSTRYFYKRRIEDYPGQSIDCYSTFMTFKFLNFSILMKISDVLQRYSTFTLEDPKEHFISNV